MTYQDYFRNSDFEDIWTVLSGFYMEHENLKPMYSSLVETIKALPADPKHSESVIRMCLDSENEIMVKGAPDPQEWLLGREVEIDFSSWKDGLEDNPAEPFTVTTFDLLSGPEKRRLARDSDTATLAAHLLYWSTLYAIKTHGQHAQEFSEWLSSLGEGKTAKREMDEEYLVESFRRKQRKYWRETVAHDSAICWSYNLVILKKKLEYNIGYWRYVQRHASWQQKVKRMQIAVSLLAIVHSDYTKIHGKYINIRTADRYTPRKDYNDAYLRELYISELYRDKAFHLLWRWLDHNMMNWWD